MGEMGVNWLTSTPGPGSYQIEGMSKRNVSTAKMKISELKNEGYYEIVNNQRVLQQRYMANNEREPLKKEIKQFQKR